MEKLITEVQKLTGYQLNNKQVQQFLTYEEQLQEWNARFNLTAVRDQQGIYIKHFLDSLSCLLAFGSRVPARLIDVGTGAGFPGIPLKICYPAMQLTLVESVGKKAEFCRHLIHTLNLDKVEVVNSRAEEIGQMPLHREKYDIAVARAVANLPILVEYLLPLVKIGGIMLAQKGDHGPVEAQSVEKSARLLGGQVQQLREIQLPGIAESRYLIILNKVAATPPQYPRRVGIPLKNPLK